jgi:Fe-S-cluster containining protein
VLPAIRRIHGEVDRRVRGLVRRNGARLRCGLGCHACCTDGLSVFEVEADRIRAGAAALLAEGAPHPAGACAFLDEAGACRVYADRPYVCRTQGLPLRWTEGAEPVEVEYRDICPENEVEGAPLEALPATDCWRIGPTEAALRALQLERQAAEAVPEGGQAEPRRVALRDLFLRAPASLG